MVRVPFKINFYGGGQGFSIRVRVCLARYDCSFDVSIYCMYNRVSFVTIINWGREGNYNVL